MAGVARDDAWTSLSAPEREAWTYGNDIIPGNTPVEAARAALLFGQAPISVPVRVVIVDPHNAARPDEVPLGDIEAVMRAGFEHQAQGKGLAKAGGSGGVMAKFKVHFAGRETGLKVLEAVEKGSVKEVLGGVVADAVEWHGGNILFVLVGMTSASAAVQVDEVQAGPGKYAWVRCHETSVFLDVLNVAEAAAERLYVPTPNHFPIPITHNIRVDLHPYTPGVDHRALWFSAFDWEGFKSQVRSIAVPGQVFGFFATQTTAECGDLCKEAFAGLETIAANHGVDAVTVLNGHVAPENASWSFTSKSPSSRDVAVEEDEEGYFSPPEFDIYVLDVVKAHAKSTMESAALKALENMDAAIFPGIALVTTRSSSKDAIDRLERELLASIMSGIYGIPDPSLYLRDTTSNLLYDVVGRTYVASVLAVYSAEVRELLDDLSQFGIDPVEALDNLSYADFVQRLNLLLYKLHKAREVISKENDISAATYYASSARFDVAAIRAMFGLDARGQPLSQAGFRDPTVRCHFSRVTRGVLLLTSRTIESSGMLVPVGSFVVGVLVAQCLLNFFEERRKRLKRH